MKRALIVAVRAGDLAGVKQAIKAHPDQVKQWLPIIDAAKAGNAAVMKLLLDKGADPNILGENDWLYRPLHRTVEYRISAPKHEGHVETTVLLLAAGANPLLRATCANMTALALASITGDPRFIALFVAKIRKYDIFSAAAIGDVRRVKAILGKNKGLARAVDEAGCDALWYCAASRLGPEDLAETASLLLEAGADPNRISRGAPPLYMAVGHAWNIPLAEKLLAAGADANTGGSLVHASCDYHFAYLNKGLEWLAAHGATVNPRDGKGYTALQKARLLKYKKTARVLQALGANA